MAKAKAAIETETAGVATSDAELATLTTSLETMSAERKQLKASVEKAKKEDDDRGASAKAAKKELDKLLQEIGTHQKQLAQAEAELDKVTSRRLEQLKKCKLDKVDLPLSSGALADVTDTEAPVTINYRGLSSEFKKVR